MKTRFISAITIALMSGLAFSSYAQDYFDHFTTFRGWKGNVSLKITREFNGKNEYNQPSSGIYNFHAEGTVDIRDEEYDENEGRAHGIWPNYDMMKQITDPEIVMRWEPKITYSNSVTEFGGTYTCTYAGVNDNPAFPSKGIVKIMLFGIDQYQIMISGPSFMEKCSDSDEPKVASSTHDCGGLFKLPLGGNTISGKQKIEKDGYVIEAEWNLTGYQ